MVVAMGCKKSEPTTSEATVGDVKSQLKAGVADLQKEIKTDVAAVKAPAKKCTDYKATGTGTFEASCKLTVAPPFDIAPLDVFKDDGFGRKLRVSKITSHFDQDVSVSGLFFFYYDADAKLIDVKTLSTNQGGVVKAGQTVELPIGYEQTEDPAGTAVVQAEIYNWSTETEPRMYFEAWTDKDDSDRHHRPKDGWKKPVD